MRIRPGRGLAVGVEINPNGCTGGHITVWLIKRVTLTTGGSTGNYSWDSNVQSESDLIALAESREIHTRSRSQLCKRYRAQNDSIFAPVYFGQPKLHSGIVLR